MIYIMNYCYTLNENEVSLTKDSYISETMITMDLRIGR